jgi:hypothetical protein
MLLWSAKDSLPVRKIPSEHLAGRVYFWRVPAVAPTLTDFGNST